MLTLGSVIERCVHQVLSPGEREVVDPGQLPLFPKPRRKRAK